MREKGGTEGGSVAPWTGQSLLLRDSYIWKSESACTSCEKAGGVHFLGGVTSPGGISILSSDFPALGIWSVVGKKAAETPWKGRSTLHARLHAAPRSTSHLGGWGPWLLRDTNRQQETRFPEIWFRLRLQHRVALAARCSPPPPRPVWMGSSPSPAFSERERAPGLRGRWGVTQQIHFEPTFFC